jgi:Fur family zinc uptake transcriptional regulator
MSLAPRRQTNPLLGRLEAVCRGRGLRLTRQRRAVLHQLARAGRALSAYELLERLRPEDGRSTPAGIYRALEFLIDAGLVHRLESTRSFILCDLAEPPTAPHAGQLLICRACGTVVESEDARLTAAAERLGAAHGFMIDARAVELTGLCGRCRAAPSGRERRRGAAPDEHSD